MRPAPITRRRFMAAGAGVLGSLGLTTFRPWRALVRFATPSEAARLMGLFTHPESARAVGMRYLETTGKEASASRLLERLSHRLSVVRSIGELDDEELRARLRSSVGSDFESGRVVDLDGWVVSTTEAYVCALAALV
jgi:hypothetical protein